MEFKILPHIGIGSVKLGMTKEEVKESVGNKYYFGSNENIDYYFENSLQVEFENNKADFIGISYNDNYIVTYEGENVFDTKAKKIFTLIAENEKLDHEYSSDEYLFPDQIISLWEADTQYDNYESYSREIWAQIGIGSSSYFEAVSRYSDE